MIKQYNVWINDTEFYANYLNFVGDSPRRVLILKLCYDFYSLHFKPDSRRHLMGFWAEKGRIKQVKVQSLELFDMYYGNQPRATVVDLFTGKRYYYILNNKD